MHNGYGAEYSSVRVLHPGKHSAASSKSFPEFGFRWMNLCFAAATTVFNSLDSLAYDLTATLEPANGKLGEILRWPSLSDLKT
jgi:hypothetical protein